MAALTRFLYEQVFRDAQLAFTLTLLELPNLLAMLAWAREALPAERVVELAGLVETLLAQVGQPRALARATRVREAATGALGAWGHARFVAESAGIDRLLERGDLPGARAAAEALLRRCLAGGEDAYPGAAYGIAEAHLRLGRVLKTMGAAEAALAPLGEAQQRFQALADAGDTDAARMASVAITESATCLKDLGRLDEAAASYEEAIEQAEKRDDRREVAVNKGNLGTVRRRQGRYDEALRAYAEARDIFEGLGEPRSVAQSWHGIGMVHRLIRQFEQAERANRQALAILVRIGDQGGEAGALDELGLLYRRMGRLEEAVTFHRQAADIRFDVQDPAAEGRSRNNMAIALIELERHDEARRELERAIACKEPFGHAAEPWTTWALLHDLERAAGDAQVAARGRQRAVETYLAYRRAGGESRRPGAQLCGLAAQAIQQGDTEEAEQSLAQAAGAPDTADRLRAMIPKLQAILQGSRDPALAADPNLYYRDAVELQLLLEALWS
jgi:tetratricopeptide (TPR) repeat protein